MAQPDFDSIRQAPEYPAPDFDSLVKSALYAVRYRAPDEPTEAQIKAGNYPKRQVPWQGMTISIENEPGSTRCGVDPSGKPWETFMHFAYGYLRATEGSDGDHVDVYLGQHPDAEFVYVVHQRKCGDWSHYDEDKVFANFRSEADAVHAFLQHYNDLRFLGPVTAMPVAEFVAKARATLKTPAMIKAHISGYTRADGSFVAPHEDRRVAHSTGHGLSKPTLDWLQTWVFHHQDAEPTDQMIAELTRYAPRESMLLHRSHLVAGKKAIGPIESWTKDKDFADWLTENPEASGGERFTKTKTIFPDEVLVDLTRLPELLQGDQSVPGQKEVVVVSGAVKKRMLAVRAALGVHYSRGVPIVKALDFGADMLLKSEHGPIPAGAHWITVHSTPGAKGSPILVMPQGDGSMRVIGGAGGALNHLKLRSVKTGEGYKDSIAAKQKERQEAQKAQTTADKASGVYDGKKIEKGKLKAAMQKQRQEFVQTVAEAMGWTDHEFDEGAHADLSPEAQSKAKKEHEHDLFKRAKEAVDVNRKMLLADHDALAASGLGDMPLQSKASDVISVSDLDPVSDKAPGLGFAASYGARAADKGLTPADVASELAKVKDPEKAAAQAAKTAEQKVAAENINKELDAFKLANPETVKPSPKVLADAQKAAGLIKAQKKLKMAEQMARQASMELANAHVIESKAYVLEASDAEVEEGARKQMEQDLKTIGAAGLLSEIDKMGGEESLGGHVGAGAFNSLNAFSTAVGGEPLIDRSVVDVLGVNAAAQILARRIAKDYEAGDYDAIRQGVEDYHVGSQSETQEKAVSQARALHDAAAAIELPDGGTGFDLAHAQELNHQRREAINDAKRILGQATGELQANAALVMAMREGAKDSIEVSLGALDAKSAVTRMHALGLKSGDYKIDDVGGNLVATVGGEGLDRLAKPVDVEGLKQIKRNLAIIRGDEDEDNWLPKGFANRPDLAMHVEAGVAPKLAKPFNPAGGDLETALRSYIGGRVADGGALQDILADCQSSDFFAKSGNPEAYRKALDAVAPLKGEDGKLKPIDTLKESFEKMADDFVASNYGPGTSALHRQNFEVDKKSVDALHRSLSATPEGVAAFKPIGDLSAQERTGLRKWWEENVGKKDAGAEGLKSDLAEHVKNEPEKSSTDMFGEESVNPDWHAWKATKDELIQKANAAGLDWNKYVHIMGSPTNAIASTQDLVRSHVVSGFASSYNTLHPDSPLKTGKTSIQGALQHLDAVDPAAREKRLAEQKALIDSLRERINGKYASGSVADKIKAQQEAQQAFEQAQMGFFSTEEMAPDLFGDSEAPKEPPIGADERFTLGHAAEQKLAGMMSVVGQNFKAGHPTKLWGASMSGKYAPQQRVLKLLEANKRVMAAFGTGSGKSAIQLAGFSHLHGLGKVKKGIIIAPSIVVGQFGGEATRYLDPGKFKWHADPSASFEERLAAYKDPDTHFSVVTHQSFRDDMLRIGAQHAGISKSEMADKLGAMPEADQAAWSKSIMDKEGFKFDYMSTDESQFTLNRAGKENSSLANVADAFSRHADYFMPASADTIKNDPSEAFDLMHKLDPDRYKDRSAFMRMYGGDMVAAKAGFKREMARYFYPSKIDPDVTATKSTINVELNDKQNAALSAMQKDFIKAQTNNASGKVDVDLMKRISPSSFDGVDSGSEEVVAQSLQKNLGILKNTATQRIIDQHPEGAKLDEAVNQANQRKGKPGIIFAHNLAVVNQIKERLEKEGHRVVSLTGADSATEKDKKRLMFNPESGERKADVMVLSDAGATGMNLQSGSWCLQYDTPMTAMTHAQRQGRVNRLGQKQNVELMDLAANHRFDRTARDRLKKKYALRELMTSPMERLDDTGVGYYIQQQLFAHKEI